MVVLVWDSKQGARGVFEAIVKRDNQNRDCQNRSQLFRRTVQAEHRNTGGGKLVSIQVKTEALRRM